MFGRKSQPHEYPDDIFDSSRMSFGDHLDELRTRMLRAVVGLVVCLGIGFVLDGIGDMVGNKNIGVGKPMLRVITYPVESQVRDFYYRRTLAAEKRFEENPTTASAERIAEVRAKYAEDPSLANLTQEERLILFGSS